MTEVGDAWEHGTLSGYQYHGCRCDPCTAANTLAVTTAKLKRIERARIEGIPDHVQHGIPSTYENWNCRCSPCVDAKSVRNAVYHASRKSKKESVCQ